MTRIKTFDGVDEENLDNEVNEWLDENFEIKIKDIKFSTYYNKTGDDEIYGCCAMIIYDNGHELTAAELIDRSGL